MHWIGINFLFGSLIVCACLINNCASELCVTESFCIISRLLIIGVQPPVETLSWWFFNRAQMANALCCRVRTGSAPKSHHSLKFLLVVILVLNLAHTLHQSFVTIFVQPLSSVSQSSHVTVRHSYLSSIFGT